MTPAQVAAFKAAAAQFDRPTFSQIREAAGLSFCNAADILALGVKQGRIHIQDENRLEKWIEIRAGHQSSHNRRTNHV